jgi:Asp-tRNA(Asn)/Glu-tRNA(Gln) amidotransferase A subunit family amidase
MDATEQAALVAKGEVAPNELLEAAIERIERSNSSVNAVVIEWFDHARFMAADPDLPHGPFRGVPFLLKDLYTSFAGQTLSNGNRALKEAGKIDAADTTLVARFKAAGLVIAGRTNSSEMGSLPTAQPVAWGATRNPWALERTPGGSSGGAAAAVAAVRQRLGRGWEHPHSGVMLRTGGTQAEPGAHHGRASTRGGGARRRTVRQPHGARHGGVARCGARSRCR